MKLETQLLNIISSGGKLKIAILIIEPGAVSTAHHLLQETDSTRKKGIKIRPLLLPTISFPDRSTVLHEEDC
jgi:hypothetical protein